jgi:hypothetical protein
MIASLRRTELADNPVARRPIVFIALAAPMAAMAEPGWVCDQPVPQEPPIGCSWWGEYLTKGFCEEYSRTREWYCPTIWYPHPDNLPPTHAKSVPSISLPLPAEFALSGGSESGRAVRLHVNTQRLAQLAGNHVPVLELQSSDVLHRGVAVSIELDAGGGAELVVRAIGEKRVRVRLPLADGVSSMLAEWRIDPRVGGQLRLTNGSETVSVQLPSLNEKTRLQLWQSYGVEPRFDVYKREPESLLESLNESLPDHALDPQTSPRR